MPVSHEMLNRVWAITSTTLPTLLETLPAERRPSAPAAGMTAAVLADRYRESRGYVDESVEQLARVLPLNPRAVMRVLQALHHIGVWTVVKNSGPGTPTRRAPGPVLTEQRAADRATFGTEQRAADYAVFDATARGTSRGTGATPRGTGHNTARLTARHPHPPSTPTTTTTPTPEPDHADRRRRIIAAAADRQLELQPAVRNRNGLRHRIIARLEPIFDGWPPDRVDEAADASLIEALDAELVDLPDRPARFDPAFCGVCAGTGIHRYGDGPDDCEPCPNGCPR